VPDQTRAPADLHVVTSAPLLRVVLGGLPPVYAQGLQLVLQGSGASCTVVHDLAQLPVLLAGPHPLVVVVPPVGVAALPVAPAGARHAVVVVLEAATPESCAAALHAGVTGVLTAADALDDVLAVLQCAGRGQTVLRRELVQALCRPAIESAPPLTAVEQTWLRSLAAGGTVAGLARSCGYSEREMYRRLSTVYLRLGARTRTEALLLAERFGLLDNRV
jgi:DNA-binding NarL/FixJ family response regulator